MLPFDVIYEEFPSGTPIKFKHDEASRKELKASKTVEELLDVIDEYHLYKLVENAAYNNDMGFAHYPVIGHIEKVDDKYFIMLDGMEPLEANVEQFEDFKATVESAPAELVDVLLYALFDEMKIYLMVFTSAAEREEFWADPDKSLRPVISLFLETTGINTLHKLGKVINKGAELHRRNTPNRYSD